MAVTESFLTYVLDQLIWDNIVSKKMFGGVGLYYNELMFCLLYEDVVALKVDDTNIKKYEDIGEKPIKVFKSKTSIPSYYTVPSHILEDKKEFTVWAKESFQIQLNKNNIS
ncbi:TfoX/Sxy family protein [Cellulophaga omnivescoria]|uniref:TfoX/Sxy family protein n=1 Tax=Cellulophaga omnivescoria TaxID=1888890 RepID=UPI0022F11C0E|nr:TfoX/Sxy family protein [Cellulophaga omnivescoria]WBU89047.1 TfoX/Sxy family protein [Cellulophaga omnivescoria]WKB81021.1 TfoX/Sxy family protein [Cellulophaga lytica]